MAEAVARPMSVEEFYLWQLDQDERYELVDGVSRLLQGMTGASNIHDTILVNGIAELAARLRGKPCRVASPDTALRTKIRTARRPDITRRGHRLLGVGRRASARRALRPGRCPGLSAPHQGSVSPR